RLRPHRRRRLGVVGQPRAHLLRQRLPRPRHPPRRAARPRLADHRRHHGLEEDLLTKFLLGRTLRLLTLLVGVAVGTFVLMSASPVDPIEAYVGADTASVSPEQRAQIADRWGLDDPPLERFVAWSGQVLQGNLGTSQVFNAPVTEVIGEKFLTSLALMAA